MINNVARSAAAIQGAGVLVQAVTGWVRGLLFQNFRIVGRNDLFEVWCCSVRHLYCVSIYDFVEGAIFWKVLIQKFEKLSPNAGFHIARIWGVPPGDWCLSLAFWGPVFGLLGFVC